MGKIELLKGLRFVFALVVAMIGIATSNDLVAVILFSLLFVVPYGFEMLAYVEINRLKRKRQRIK